MSTSKPVPISQHHAIFVQRLPGASGETAPIVYLTINNKPVLFNALIDYYLAFPNKSITWKRNVARSIGLFWDFCVATKELSSIWGKDNSHRRAFRHFSLALLRGTIDPSTQKDETGLYWPPCSFDIAKRLTSSLTDFIDWCDFEGIIETSITKDVRPSNESNTLSFLHKALRIKGYSFLSHLKSSKEISARLQAKQQSLVIDLGKNTASSDDPDVKMFPPDLISPLLEYGFVTNEDALAPEDREDLTAKLITILMLFGGTRISEPYHLWFNDVIPEHDGSCKVFLRHPSEAKTYLQGEGNKTRRLYLLERKLTPRDDESNSKSYKAGWKDLNVDSSLNAPVFFVHEGAEHLFREIFLYYLRYRSTLLATRRHRGLVDHPFLFVSRGIDKNSGKDFTGEPYSIGAYNKALERALVRTEKKLGISIPRGKMAGTTPHGFRHWYGTALAENGMGIKVIQKCMRHRSPMSQGVYTAPTLQRVTDELERAREEISKTGNNLLPKQPFLIKE